MDELIRRRTYEVAACKRSCYLLFADLVEGWRSCFSSSLISLSSLVVPGAPGAPGTRNKVPGGWWPRRPLATRGSGRRTRSDSYRPRPSLPASIGREPHQTASRTGSGTCFQCWVRSSGWRADRSMGGSRASWRRAPRLRCGPRASTSRGQSPWMSLEGTQTDSGRRRQRIHGNRCTRSCPGGSTRWLSRPGLVRASCLGRPSGWS